MHDINSIDKLGIPGLIVATDKFKQAATAQSKSLGFEPSIVWVSHPVQNKTSEEMSALVDGAFEAILANMTTNGSA